MSVLQLRYIFDSVPRTLPVWLLVLGLEALIFGFLIRAGERSELFRPLSARSKLVTSIGLTFGYLFVSLSVISAHYDLYAAYLFVLFRTVEGAAAVRFYRKVVHVLRHRSTDLSSGTGRAYKYVSTFFVSIVGTGIFIQILLNGPYIHTVLWDLALVYTGVSLAIAVIGAWWRLRDVRDGINSGISLGVLLVVGGAEIFNYTLLAQEIVVTLFGSLSYSIGFWGAVLIRVKT